MVSGLTIGQLAEVRVYDLREGCATNECREKATRYGVTAVPAVAVDGVLLDCCRRGPIDAAALWAAGIGQASVHGPVAVLSVTAIR